MPVIHHARPCPQEASRKLAIAKGFLEQGQHAEALSHLNPMEDCFRSDDEVLWIVHGMRASAHLERGHVAAADCCARKQAALAAKLKDERKEMWTRLTIARVLNGRRRHGEALWT